MTRLAPFVVSVALVVAACTSSAVGPPVTTTTSTPDTSTMPAVDTTTTVLVATTIETPDGFGGEVTIGVDFPIETLNPFAENAFGVRTYGNLVWATVYDIDPDTWDRIPDVVEAMPSKSGGITANDDGTMSVTYKIIDEATWGDGVPISGDDIVFTAAAMADIAVAGPSAVDPIMTDLVDATADGKSATLTFAVPSLAVEDAFWIILPAHVLEGVDLVNGTDGTEWPSGGPFVLEGFDDFGEIRFARNDMYWKTDGGDPLPYLDAVTIVATTEPGSQGDEPTTPIPAFVAGAVDVAPIPPVPLYFDQIEGAVANGAGFHYVPTPVIEHLTFNFSDVRLEASPDSPNQFIDFRRALASSIDRRQILDETGVAWFFETPGMLVPVGESAWSVYEAGITQIPELPEGAASILSTTANADERPKIADALAPAFTAAGVSYEVDLQDSQEFFQATIVESTYDIGMWAWVSDGGYASQLGILELFDPRVSPPDGNFGNWGSGGSSNDATARYTEIVDEASTTVDQAEFISLVREAEAILATELPVIPLFSRGSGLAVWPDAVSGVTHNGSRSDFTWNIELWQRP